METSAAPTPAKIRVRTVLCDKGLTRVGRETRFEVVCVNEGTRPVTLTGTLTLPTGMYLGSDQTSTLDLDLDPLEEGEFAWTVGAREPVYADMVFTAVANGRAVVEKTHPMRFLPEVRVPDTDYIPEPEPVDTEILVGAHHCPLWEAERPGMWDSVLHRHPERTPVLGFYDQENPEVADWETKWAVEHGVSYFIYCWYRVSQGGPVETRFSSAIDPALFQSRFADKMRFTIMWENQARGRAGVADEADLMENLMPFWMENYFKHPSYLKIDNKPVLFIYRPEFLVDDLGGEANVTKAFDKMRQACRDEGFDGLYLLGEYRGLSPDHLRYMKNLGLDYTFAYCWHIQNNPTPEQAIHTQMGYIQATQDLDIIPQVVTVSQAWSGWNDEGSIWKIPPAEFRTLLQAAKDFIEQNIPEEQLGRRTLILDNWNEWGEGHYIAPYREYGFGYLDAVREVFSDAPDEHLDLIPEDLGMGPYDQAYRDWLSRTRELRSLMCRKITRPGALEGLVAWWSFDEDPGTPVVLDYAGNRLGGRIYDATRAPGRDGSALVCDGGAVTVEHNPLLFPEEQMTLECRVYTETPDQQDNWIVNCVFTHGNTGYRLGVSDGEPCFAVPQGSWSHHLHASEPLPLGRWVHLAGTYDGQAVRLYVDGELQGTMERTGPINPVENGPLILGSYQQGHTAFFRGLVDEIRLYNRALTGSEIQGLAR